MPLNRPTIQQIYDRMKADTETRVTGGLSFPKTTLVGILNLVFSGAIHLSYGFLVWLADQLFPDTAESDGLDRLARQYGVPRKAANFTTGTILIAGSPAHVIAANTSMFNSDGLNYLTDAELTIDEFGTISGTVTAEEPGEDYNTDDATLTLSNPDPSVVTISTTSGFDDGEEKETDEDLSIRVLQRIQNPPSSGTCGDYERWALEVTGVGKAWCFGAEDWAGAGTVGLGVSDENLFPVSAQVLTDVETYVETVRPEPASVDYFTINDKEIRLTISIKPNTATIRDAIDANMNQLFLQKSSPGGTILLSQMNTAVAAGLVEDYQITGITEDSVPIPVDNITQTGYDVSRLDNITYNTLP
jgi:uncharacterized phage protein gp47/JayE